MPIYLAEVIYKNKSELILKFLFYYLIKVAIFILVSNYQRLKMKITWSLELLLETRF